MDALSFIMEAHNGLSARIVQEAGFKGIWASGLSISASLGVRDCNEASWTQVLDVLEFMSDATDIPILVDGDSGYGNFNNVRRLVKKLEQRGIAGVCIEDKEFPKKNSFMEGHPQCLSDIGEFCGKIRAAQDSKTDPDFVVVARVEAFIAGRGLDEALRQAEAYRLAGADAILIHSKKPDFSEIGAFMKEWGQRHPVIIVPTKYFTTPTETFRKAGISLVIWANQNLRAAAKAMQEVSGKLQTGASAVHVEPSVACMAEILRLTGASELYEAEKKYLPVVPPCMPGRMDGVLKENQVPTARDASPARLDTVTFGNRMKELGYGFFSGVPCSFLKGLINFAINECTYVISANEGEAVAACAGASLGGQKAVVLMQNSGLTNAVSPLTSLTNIFRLPVLGFVSLRGEPGIPDEPQHELMGSITTRLLDLMQIPWAYLSSDLNVASAQLLEADRHISDSRTFFFVVRKGTFAEVRLNRQSLQPREKPAAISMGSAGSPPFRREALECISRLKDSNTILLATTGKTGRELCDLDDAPNNFYMVGSMGCVLSLGLGLAMSRPATRIIAIDGDGALLMRLSSITTAGYYRPPNLLHILLDNATHDSTGGQSTLSPNVDFPALAVAGGYPVVVSACTTGELAEHMGEWQRKPQLTFIHLRIAAGTPKEPGRPSLRPHEIKERLIRFMNE
jgi:phosphonopyruvate decarboxylase